jgi:H+/Cl- antiporter ClcA
MLKSLSKPLAQFGISRDKTFLNAAIWIAAGLMGTLAVFYARLIAYFQGIYFLFFKENPIVVSLSGPILFLLATWVVQKFGPDAKGSGIPQVLAAIHQSDSSPEEQVWKSPLISIRTAIVKVFSSVIGILGGGLHWPRRSNSANCSLWICMDRAQSSQICPASRYQIFSHCWRSSWSRSGI